MTPRTILKRGFTLIELLVVISIIGVLASIVLAALGGARASAGDTKRLSEFNQLKTMLEEFNIQYGHYPVSDPLGNNATYSQCWSSSGGNWLSDNGNFAPVLAFMPKQPVDTSADCSNATWPGDPAPGAADPYQYMYWSNGQQYYLLGRFQNANNPQSIQGRGCISWTDGNCYTDWQSWGWYGGSLVTTEAR